MNITVFDILELGYNHEKTREFLEGIFAIFGYSLEHDERGDYDSGKDGWLIFKHPEEDFYIRVNLEEDSYSGGYYTGHSRVKPKQKTITVWE